MTIQRFRLVLLLVLSVVERMTLAEDWPHWRGTNRNDRVAENSGWDQKAWPLSQPAWSAKVVTAGGTSPLVVAGRVYVMGWTDGKDSVFCLDLADRREIWNSSYDCPKHGRRATGDEELYSGPTATPEFDPETGFLYTLSCDGDLCCWNTKERGAKVWGLNLYQRYEVPRRPKYGRQGLRDYGYTTSPLIFGDWLIVEVGDDEGNLMAFSRKTGERVWASEYKGPAGHSGGIVPMSVEGVPCVAVLSYAGLHVARVDSPHAGKTVALFEWGTDFANNVATPAVHGNEVLITSAYNRTAICKVRVTLAGATKVWEQPFASKICSPIIHKGRVYWAWQSLRCLDFETGEMLWEGGEFGDAGSCVVTADDRILVFGNKGRLVLADIRDANADKYHELARLDRVFSTEVWPHVVLADRRILCKDRLGNLKCFSLEGQRK